MWGPEKVRDCLIGRIKKDTILTSESSGQCSFQDIMSKPLYHLFSFPWDTTSLAHWTLWVQESALLNNVEFSLSLSLETTELGSKKELKSMPFITYLSGLLTAQMLSDDQLISGVEIRCEEKGRCPSTCHLCRRPGKEQLSPTPVLLEINRVVPLYTLIQDNGTKEVSSPDTATNSHLSTSLPPSCPCGPFVHWDCLSSPSWWWLTFIDPLPYFKYIYSCYNQ